MVRFFYVTPPKQRIKEDSIIKLKINACFIWKFKKDGLSLPLLCKHLYATKQTETKLNFILFINHLILIVL